MLTTTTTTTTAANTAATISSSSSSNYRSVKGKKQVIYKTNAYFKSYSCDQVSKYVFIFQISKKSHADNLEIIQDHQVPSN